ncbi:MAG: hypothetical protein GTO51_04550 [Candidatus Latescibacteria bacterium]|nr:hypothetical protein [Candidatus Latescibacterota bacterium]NIM21112.1 hypothetical protein [Candidatus Latescibacterota bacterium]NIM65247.1 hypothetical protein [Candidatus Latescibacterota bacterium]NIO01762.1 hypothetical protein [Candidatus Latescibacterota bacterium]NIO28279.1 hypothetical protein [Candidatus Latescibacterota bacterium]
MKSAPKTLTVIVVGLLLSCAGPPKTRIDRIYSGLSESLPRLEPTILKGRKIIVDPGHGGVFRGTVGQDSLEEARVNLGVSLYLWGLLTEAGAEVTLTRSAERDFLVEADSNLAIDLEARIALACSLKPDIFISIHHNAQSDRDPDVNSVETYYRTGDPASMDLAFAIHRHLMRNLGVSNGEVRQGNYYVLRNAKVPAIIGEASYLTHPPVEESLKLSEKQRLEAEAYFLGILEYFQRGIPRLHRISPEETTLSAVPTIVYRTEDDGGLGIDPDAVLMHLNDHQVVPVFDPVSGRITYRLAWDSPNGPYSLSLAVRNLLGNSSHRIRQDFTIDFPPERAVFAPYPSTLPEGGGIVRMNVRLLDGRGLQVADGTFAEISTFPEGRSRRAVIKDGVVEFPIFAPADIESLSAIVSCKGQDFSLVMKKAAASVIPLKGTFIVDDLSGTPITRASIMYGDSVIQTGSQAGLYHIPITKDTSAIHIRALGYRPLSLSTGPADTLRLSPWFEGKLAGTRFLIDPEGGPPSKSGAGKLGLSGAYVNLKVARYLASYLWNAGAVVALTRESEEIRVPQDIVIIANRFNADRYIEIRHRSVSGKNGLAVSTYHFPGSHLGNDLAEEISFSLSALLGLPPRSPAETVTYPLQQTACPAVVIDAPSLDTVDEELRLAEAWYQRLQAYGIFLGTLNHFGVAEQSSLAVRITGRGDPANWLVTVDGTWKLLTGPDGTATFYALPEGDHTVEIQREDRRLSQWIVLRPDTLLELAFTPYPNEG